MTDLVDTGFWLEDGKIIERHTQDVEPILDQNTRLRTHSDGYSPTREFRRAASIPHVVVHQWLMEGFDIFDPNNEAELRRRLNSQEWEKLRTAEGNL